MRADKYFFLLCFILCSILSAQTALGHSTKDRVKIPLIKETLTIDDLAYFIEPYVHFHLYADQPNSKSRYIAQQFRKITQDGNTVQVDIIVLDKKTNDTYPRSLRFTRAESGLWVFPTAKGKTIEVFTYVTKKQYFWTHWARPLAFGITGLIALCTGLLWWKKKKNAVPGALETEA